MKTKVKISLILLALTVAGSASLEAQRGMRGMGPGRMYYKPDSARLELEKQVPDTFRFRAKMRMNEPGRAMRPGDFNRPDGFWGRDPRMVPGYGMMPRAQARSDNQQFPMRQGRYAPPAARGNRPDQVPGISRGRAGYRIAGNIPDLTEKQKADLEKLREDQQTEMEKFRAEYSAKMKELREGHRNKVLGILTDEQKKSLENEPSKPEAPVAPAINGRTRR